MLLLGLRGCAGWTAGAVVASLPPSADAAIGKAAAESIRAQRSAGPAPTNEQTARAERVFDELRRGLTPEEARLLVSPRVTVLGDATPNAFALPGGEVFVLTGLLDRTKGDDGQLRGVLAHELGHAVHRHGVRGLVRNAAYGIAFLYLLGDVDGLLATIVAGAAELDELRYGRAMEEEADAFAVDLLRRTGHDANGLAKFLESLEKQPIPEILSTHPDSAERAEAIRERSRAGAKAGP